MKLKALLVAGAVCLASAVNSSAAEVFSANTVGFVNVNVPTGFSMIANPVIAADNSLNALLGNVPIGTQIFKFSRQNASYEIFEYSQNPFTGNAAWSPNGDAVLLPGEGAFISNPDADYTITFTGEVALGPSSNSTIGVGFSIVSSVVPQSGKLQENLSFPAEVGDQVFLFNAGTQSYQVFEYSQNPFTGNAAWSPSEPEVRVAESFFVNKVSDNVAWNRDFDPNKSADQ